MACPDENVLASYIQGGLDPQSRRELAFHFDGCESCTILIAELGRVMSSRVASLNPLALGPALPSARSQRAGRYLLGEVLGSGGWGTVYRAQDPELGRSVAIKVVRADLSAYRNDAERLGTRLLQEARAMAQLAHPNVVPIFEVGTTDGAVFLVMELVGGGSLRAWLRTNPPNRGILRLFREVGEGLAAAHTLRIVHRDFKPDNVLVGLDGRPRVTDFGLAVLARPAGGPEREIVGTPAYAAPEQVFGDATDERADQFAFAVSLYEALYRAPPFMRGDLQHMRWVYASARARPPPAAQDVPAGVGVVLLRALSVRPADRFPTLRAMLDALDAEGHGSERVHVRINAAIQVLAAPVHVFLLVGWLVGARNVETRQAPRAGSAGDIPITHVIAGAGLVFWIIFAFSWLFLGAFWAPFNAWALLTRRRFARVSTLLYAAASVVVCIGIPYAIYAVWSMTRPNVKSYFATSPWTQPVRTAQVTRR